MQEKITWIEKYADRKKMEIELISLMKKDGSALKYIKNQTEEICFVAVDRYRYALRYVGKVNFPGCNPIKQTNAICIAAIKKDPWSLIYVEKQTEKICLMAVK